MNQVRITLVLLMVVATGFMSACSSRDAGAVKTYHNVSPMTEDQSRELESLNLLEESISGYNKVQTLCLGGVKYWSATSVNRAALAPVISRETLSFVRC